MRLFRIERAALLLPLVLALLTAKPVMGDGDLSKVKHIIIVMQENHSFDNYFGVLAYAPGSPCHHRPGGCRQDDHACVDGLTCKTGKDGSLSCFNSNLDDDGSLVFSFHDPKRCAPPDLNHGWFETHEEVNFLHPNNSLRDPDSDGFVRVNDATEQLDKCVEECSQNLLSTTDTTVIDAAKLCPEFAINPGGPYPEDCATFDQLGVRVPFLAVSPFSKPHHVSHTVGDHTSLLALVE